MKDFYNENDKVYEIFSDIAAEGVNYKRLRFIVLMIFVFLLSFYILMVTYISPGIFLNIISISFSIISLFMLFVIINRLIYIEDNKKYKYLNIQEEIPSDFWKEKTQSKIIYHNNRNDKFDKELIRESVLTATDIEIDIKILDFHIDRFKDLVRKNDEKKPLFLKNQASFFIFFMTIAVQIGGIFYSSDTKIDLFFKYSVLIVSIFLIAYMTFYLYNSFKYKMIINKKSENLNYIIRHLEIIKLKRLHVGKQPFLRSVNKNLWSKINS